MKLAAIDIGSNAVRLQITNTLEWENNLTFKKLEYIRFPLRLGNDVFNTGRISEFNKERFMKLMNAYRMMIDLYEVDQFYACATSAMRESENGGQIVQRVKDQWNLEIELIDGQKEARMINEAVKQYMENSTYLHIDVGGGSTELNFYSAGKLKATKSFMTGSVRRLNGKEPPEIWSSIENWIHEEVVFSEELLAVGTGGNINKLFELTSKKDVGTREVKRKQLRKTLADLREYSMEEKLLKLQLNADRADVIVPASEIYLGVMELAGAKKIKVPDVGLKDGINLMLYERGNPNHGKVWVRN